MLGFENHPDIHSLDPRIQHQQPRNPKQNVAHSSSSYTYSSPLQINLLFSFPALSHHTFASLPPPPLPPPQKRDTAKGRPSLPTPTSDPSVLSSSALPHLFLPRFLPAHARLIDNVGLHRSSFERRGNGNATNLPTLPRLASGLTNVGGLIPSFTSHC
ncbi:hypothetical protein LZ31DRAFT_560810 [Colletotrichum somersetense]|nr:hypothetical protein LZ31DRAFT_560810 [Colletotrichum somersetense]